MQRFCILENYILNSCMPTNKNASFRYRVLNGCFRDGSRRWTIDRLIERVAGELDEQFGISKGISARQLKEDIHIMRSLAPRGFDAPVVCRDGAYFYDDPEFSIEKKSLNTDDVRSLTEAVSLLRQFRGLPHFQEIEAILTKIEGKTLINDPDGTIISFENTRLTRGYEYLARLHNAIRNGHALAVHYRPFHAPTDDLFTLHAYYLREYRQRWYVFGWIAEKETVYNLALDRIMRIEEVRDRYRPNRSFQPEAYFRDIVGVTRPAHAIPQRIVLRVKSETAPYLITRPIHASQQLTGSQAAYALFEYLLIPNFEFVGEILRLADAAEILEPEDLRKMFAVKTASMGLAYRERPGSGQ